MSKPLEWQRGFTLLEVLVALVVLSIGLIGLAGLQSVALKQNYNAYLRSQAVALAYDMADRMRSNNLGAAKGFYHNPAPTSHSDCTTMVGCAADQLAENDMSEWAADLGALLPMGTGLVCQDSTPESLPSPLVCDGTGPTHVVRVVWDDNRDGVATVTDPNEAVIVSFRP